MTPRISRRQFLQTAAGAGASSLLPAVANAQAVDIPITHIIKQHANTQWRDQYSQTFDVNAVVGKPYILVFGFNGCQFCNKITHNLARLRNEGGVAQDVPIVVVNITPEKDFNDRRDFVAGYYGSGICQTLEEARRIKSIPDKEQMEAAQKAYDADKNIPAKDRKFHLVFPPSNKAAQDPQAALGVIRNVGDDTSHGLKMALVDGSGKCVVSEFAATDDDRKCAALVQKMADRIKSLQISVGK